MSLPADFHELHPETQTLLRAGAEKGGKSFEDADTVEESRAIVEGMCAQAVRETNYQFNGEKKIYSVQVPGNQADIPLWVYRPDPCPPNPTILVYFHGGGFVICSVKTHEIIAQMLCDSAECIVVNVEYRRAPENKFPGPLEDCKTAFKWVVENKTVIGGSTMSKLGTIGDSVGGQLATTIAYEVPDVAFQVLLYPVTDWRINRESAAYKLFGVGYFLTTKQMEWNANHAFSSASQCRDPRSSPLMRSKLENLPPALYIAASHDVLVDEGKDYVEKLKKAGVHAETVMLHGVTHAFMNFPNIFKANVDIVLKKINAFVKIYGS